MLAHVRNRLDLTRLRRALAPTASVPVIRLGSPYGGWVVPERLVTADSVVYSAGVGEDVTFDLALIARTGCNVWAFDPTPRAVAFGTSVADPHFHFMPVGLWSSDCTRRFHGPIDPRYVSYSTVSGGDETTHLDATCRSLASLMRELGHTRVDLLKLDIEGAEFDVLGALVEARPRCVCVELHQVRPLAEIVAFVRGLEYEIVALDGWNVTLLRAGE